MTNLLLKSRPDGPYVLLAMGQSNMSGAAGSGEGDSAIESGIKIWNGSAMITAEYGTSPLGSSVNSAVWFANYLRRSGVLASGREIWIIPNWLGGEPIEGWVGAGTSSDRWVELLAMLSGAGVTRIDHAMWSQGEANSTVGSGTAKTLATYRTHFNTLVSQLRGLSQWTATTGLTVSQLGTWGNIRTNDRNDFFAELAIGSDPYVRVVSAAGSAATTFNNDGNGDNSHHNGTSLQLMGQRHFEAATEMQLGLGKAAIPLTTSSGGPWGYRIRKDISGTYRVTQEDLAGNALLYVTGNVTIVFPELGAYGLAGQVTIDKTDSSMPTVTLNGGSSNFLLANGTLSASPDLFSTYRYVATIVGHKNLWRVTTAPIIGARRNSLISLSTNTTLSDSILPGALVRFTSAVTATLGSVTFAVTGAFCSLLHKAGGAPTIAATTGSNLIQVDPGRCTVIRPGTGYAPSDTLTVAGGTGTAATLTVQSTRVVSATVAAGGSGGTNGTRTVTGTTGTGTPFQASVTVSGGAITAVLSITVNGVYTANPTTITNEPVTGASLTGAALNVVMGVNAVTGSVSGNYTVLPSIANSPTGGGSGCVIGLTFNNLIRGINPQLQELSRTVDRIDDLVRVEHTVQEWRVLTDTSRSGNTHRLDGTTLTTGTLAPEVMLRQRTYEVAAGAALTLPFAAACRSGSTQGFSAGVHTLAPQSGDSILVNGVASTSAVLIPPNSPWVLHAIDGNRWLLHVTTVMADKSATGALTAAVGDNVLVDLSSAATSATVTFTNGSANVGFTVCPDVGVELTLSTTGGLPTNFATSTRYFVLTSSNVGGSGDVTLATTRTGSAITAGSAGSGTQTATYQSYPIRLPSSPLVGGKVRVELRGAHSVLTALLDFNSSTVNGLSDIKPYRFAQRGEWMEFVCVGANAWQVSGHGVRTSIGKGVRTSSIAVNGTNTLIQFTQADMQNGVTVRTGATSALVIRRAGQYRISAFASAPQASDLTLFFNNVLKWLGGAVTYTAFTSNGASYPSVCNPTLTTYLEAGQEISLTVQTSATETDTNRAIWFEACEVITEY
jgi:hypothetical protein